MTQKIQFAVLSLGLIALTGCTSDLRQEPYSLEASSEKEIDIDAGIHWVDQHTDVNNLMPYSPVVLMQTEVKEKWESFRTRLEIDYAFHDKLTGSAGKNEPTRIVAVNIMGTLGGFEVRESFYQGLLKKGIVLREVSCLCKSGSGCVLETGSEINFCLGDDCQKCSMTVSDPGEPGNQ